MATVTGFTADRMLEIENETVVSGLVDVNGDLLLYTREGTEINAGYVKGDPGDDATVPDASETVKGKAEIATSAEVITGTDNTRMVSPAGLATLTATDLRKGLVELATAAETRAGTDTSRAITPEALSKVAGMISIVPTSVTVSSGSASVSSDGEVTFSGVGILIINGVFTSKFRKYLVVADEILLTSAEYVHMRFTSGGTWYAGSNSNYSTGLKQTTGVAGHLSYGVGVSHITLGYCQIPFLSHFEIRAYDPSVLNKSSDVIYDSLYGSGVVTRVFGAGNVQENTSFDGIALYHGATSFSGKVRVYGFV